MSTHAGRMVRIREWLVSVEQAWIGWSLAPPERVLADAAWGPDEFASYCGRCGGSVGAGEQTPDGCGSCRGNVVTTDRVVRLDAYRDPMRAWVRAIKYRAWAEMAASLGHRLGETLHAALRADGELGTARVVVTPIPMPWQRRIYRGIDHAGLIADGAAAAMGAGVLRLLAADNGPPQVSLSAARRSRRGGRMTLRDPVASCLRDAVIVLIDDVRTSGASLNAAARLVRRLRPRRIVAGVLAVTDDPARRALGGGPRP